MQLKKFKFGLGILELLLIILAVFLLIFLLFRLIKFGRLSSEDSLTDPKPTQDQDQDQNQDQDPTNENNPIPDFYGKVVNTLPNMAPELQEYITAQAMHETGIFTSPLFLKYNNAFGMKQPTQRQTTSQGITETGYASYDSVEDSIKDLALYFEAKNYPENFETVADYVKTLKDKGYFEATLKSYTNAVTKHLNNVLPFAQ